MDCRSFKKKHLAFLDDTLPGLETTVMHEHLRACSSCARQDASVRRSLLLLRNLPPVQPSADFSDRLQIRLATERAHGQDADFAFPGPSVGKFVSIAGALVAVGILSVALVGSSEAVRETYPRLPSVVVAGGERAPELVDSEVAAPAFVASMSTGMPVWPTLLLAEEGSLRFARAELRPASYHTAPQY